MKILNGVIVVIILLLAWVPVSEAQPQFQQVIEVTVRPGYEQLYENYVKNVIEAYNKVESDLYWITFEADIGASAPTYRVILSFDKWAERDSWPSGVLLKALGEEELRRISNEMARATLSRSMRIWEYLPDGSSNVTTGGPVADFYEVQIIEIERDRVSDYQLLQSKFKAAYEAAASKPAVNRRVLRIGESPRNTFKRSAPFNKWAERDELNVGQILGDHYGPEEWQSMQNISNEIIIKHKSFISTFRPDLSRRSEQTPTTNP